jgi:hypothetical protein
MTAMTHRTGRGDVVFVAPHAETGLGDAARHLLPDPEVQAALADRVALWHDGGTLEALEAAVTATGAPGLRPNLPRGLLDLNRGWRGRVEAQETLFGKGALDQWVRARLAPGGEAALEAWYRQAMSEMHAATRGARGFVELHSYGDLGSTYDQQAGGRPVRRSESSCIHGAPWNTAFPVGVARLIPASLRGTPWTREAAIGRALVPVGLTLGPGPYPSLIPWSVTSRFLASRWFGWLGQAGVLPIATTEVLEHLAWTDEQSEAVDRAVATGEEPDSLRGVAALAAMLTRWTHEGADLADRFQAETGVFTVGIELRIDRVDRAEAWGAAVAQAVVAE